MNAYFGNSLVVRTPCFHYRGGGEFLPCSGNLRSCMLCGAAKEVIVTKRMFILWNWELNCVDLMVEDKEALSPLPTKICLRNTLDIIVTIMVAVGEGWRERIVQKFGMDRYTVLYLKWITNKDLLYSTDNSAQCYVAAWMRAESGGELIHVCVWLSPLTVHLKLSPHC